MTDKELAIVIRRALLMVVAAIEKKFNLGTHAPGRIEEIQPGDSVAGVPYVERQV